MTERKYRCQLPWSLQAGCSYAKGDNNPHSECLAKPDFYCKKANSHLTSKVEVNLFPDSLDGS